MHSTEPIVYTEVDAEHFKNLEVLAQKNGLSVVGTSGRTKKDGVEVSWDYNSADETLTLVVIQSPFWMPEQLIKSHFDQWIKDTVPEDTTAPSPSVPEPVQPQQ